MEEPMGLDICFCEGSVQVGKRIHYKDPDRIYDLLRAAHCQQEDHHMVAMALGERRPGSLELHLTEEQYNKLKRG
jgi:hypothetical protein